MFNPLNMGKQAKMAFEVAKLQKELEKIESFAEKGRAVVVASGGIIPKIKSIKINGEEMMDVKDAINDAIEKSVKKTAQKMQEEGGALGGLLGGK